MRGRPPAGQSDIQRKIDIILAMKLPVKPLPKPKPVPVAVTAHKIISALDRFDRKIDVALFMSDHDR